MLSSYDTNVKGKYLVWNFEVGFLGSFLNGPQRSGLCGGASAIGRTVRI